jgi:hypothetical protein
MAFTEKFVTPAGAGNNDGLSFANAMTFAQAITDASGKTGQRYNLAGAFGSVGATTFPDGALGAPNVWRGCETTEGDLDDAALNADGTLDTTGMPTFTITGLWATALHTTFQNLNITGALNSRLIGATGADSCVALHCRIENTANNASANTISWDDGCAIIGCDLICSGATHGSALIVDSDSRVISCRITITDAKAAIGSGVATTVADCVFQKLGSVGGSGITVTTALTTARTYIVTNCTFHNFAAAVTTTGTHTGGQIIISGCHCTDGTYLVDNTTTIAVYDINNRTRDLTSGKATGAELITTSAVTTDTGGAETDYVDAANGNYRLLTTAAGYNARFDGGDIGGLQTDPPAGGGGGFFVSQPGRIV